MHALVGNPSGERRLARKDHQSRPAPVGEDGSGPATLAIAAPRFGSPSETFIRDHVRALAPGSTILICQDGEGVEALACPALADLEDISPRRGLLRRMANSLARRWQQYVDPSLLPAEAGRVRAYIEQHKPALLLVEYGNFACKFVRLSQQLNLPLVAHFHGFDASMLLLERRQVAHYRRLFGHAAAIVCPSEYLAGRLRAVGCPSEKLHVCPYGIDPERFPAEPGRPRQFLAVGRLVDKKAPHLTIAAFATVVEAFPDALLHMVGEGPLRELCETTIGELGLGQSVLLHGAQPAQFVADLMSSSTIFVQHSVVAPSGDTEGLPVAILEAMTSGLAVVSTRHAGIPEAVTDGVTGILVDEGDVAGMAQAMLSLAADPALAVRLGEAGRRRALAQFSQASARDRLRQALVGAAVPGSALWRA